MKVLLITPNDILKSDGGGIGVRKFYFALKDMNLKLYVYSPNELNESYIVANKNRINDIMSRIKGHSNYMYVDYKVNRDKVLKLNPDVIILSNSRLGFIAKDISLNLKNTKIITHVDNIEYDYCCDYMNKYKGMKRFLLKKIEKKNVKSDEGMAFKYSNHIIFLTKRDRERAKYIYNNRIKNSTIPVCLEKKNIKFKSNNYKVNFVFLASLWYKPNCDGIIWFIENVWKKIDYSDCSLIIGGRNPYQELTNYNGKFNIKVYPNFNSIENIVYKNSVFISPIFDGSGMKVKVAEALSMGFSIIASNESLVGYEEIIDRDNKCIYHANNSQEFIKQINNFISNFENIDNDAIIMFEKYYSYNRVKNDLIKVLEENS
ncbi:glycosyltransferase [Clostridium fermenticellae]|uniref:Glycosyltransferase n=1 Tax=Clostridium fermenticellae TaxID=2068654 RepID=A0A386H0X3_9CLOT|nr:glycosyltransferase [Clostridium fermenticellae]AYD39332.1 glycosyltransferase [Clostridium fermenticellae]